MHALKKLLPIALVLALTIIAVVYNVSTHQPLTEEINNQLDKAVGQIDRADSVDSMGGLSSNPYDYIENNADYDALISAGYDALPVLEENLRSSKESGLKQYIICIAIEEITGCDLKQFEDSTWDSAAGFKPKWNQYLKEVPARVDSILKSSETPAQKEHEITKLGAPAIPYVVQHAESIDKEQNSRMAATLDKMMKNGKPAQTVAEFGMNNAATIQKMQEYVENR